MNNATTDESIERDNNEKLSLTSVVLTVSQLAACLKKTVEQGYSNVRVRAEVSGLKKHTSGHLYFSLKDQDAVIDAVSWRGMLPTSGVTLEDGLDIIATGKLTTYPGRSKYQMIVSRFEAAGIGALLKQLEDRKQRLAAEGLFDASRKKQLPRFPRIIGVVTSPTGAVIRDILHRLQDRFPCHVIVWPVLVQGPGAADQITAAIQGFNTLTFNRPDLLIVARGGGSLEDLWSFNEESVVRAVADSETPVISAVGHETDTTLIDFASDCRAPTPTAAAEMAVPVLMDLWGSLKQTERLLTDKIGQALNVSMLRVTALANTFRNPEHMLLERFQRINELETRLTTSVTSFTQQRVTRLVSLTIPSPKIQIMTAFNQHISVISRLNQAINIGMISRATAFTQWSDRLMNASYERQLEKGFCLVTTVTGEPITHASDAPQTASFTLRFQDATLSVKRADYQENVRTEPYFFQQDHLVKRRSQKRKLSPCEALERQPSLFGDLLSPLTDQDDS